MNQEKIGSLMKELRKEKGFTQEQLAEKFNVSSRTISRWENGRNMPDLDILIEMSDFYEIDLRELLNGERKSEDMDKELKETVLMVADYSNEEKSKLNTRMHLMFLVGFLDFLVFFIIEGLGLENTSPYEEISSFGLGVAFGMIVIGVLFTSKYALGICKLKKRILNKMDEEKQ